MAKRIQFLSTRGDGRLTWPARVRALAVIFGRRGHIVSEQAPTGEPTLRVERN